MMIFLSQPISERNSLKFGNTSNGKAADVVLFMHEPFPQTIIKNIFLKKLEQNHSTYDRHNNIKDTSAPSLEGWETSVVSTEVFVI